MTAARIALSLHSLISVAPISCCFPLLLCFPQPYFPRAPFVFLTARLFQHIVHTLANIVKRLCLCSGTFLMLVPPYFYNSGPHKLQTNGITNKWYAQEQRFFCNPVNQYQGHGGKLIGFNLIHLFSHVPFCNRDLGDFEMEC